MTTRLGARPKSLSVFFIAIAAVAFLLHSSQLHVKIAHYGRLYDDDEVDEVSRVQSDSEGGGSPSWWKHATSIFFPPTAPSLVDIALDGSWRGNNITAFNERNVALLESCRSGGKCKKNQDKLVSGPTTGMLERSFADHTGRLLPMPENRSYWHGVTLLRP